jgi:hypothetical protein
MPSLREKSKRGCGDMMDWERLLSVYAGSPIKVWIEDRSGEEQTQPKPFTLFKVKQTDDQRHLQFFINATQFLSVPIIDDELTKLEQSPAGACFVSHDLQAKLHYWVYFEKASLP